MRKGLSGLDGKIVRQRHGGGMVDREGGIEEKVLGAVDGI